MKRVLTTLLAGLAGIQGLTLMADERPKLVVGIVVDQLRTDYLENLRDMFGTGGFRRLMDNGIFFKDIEFQNLPGDAASAAAVIQTGSFPRYNGVTGAYIFDETTKTLRPIFADDSYIGNFTSEKYSPAALRLTTLSDEINLEDRGESKVHAIAPDAASALILAGHSGNSAFWINDETGNWSSSTYYPNPPASIQNRNYSTPLVSRLDTMKWVPLRKGEPYPFVSPKEIKDGFKYSFSRSDRDVFSLYKVSPFVNNDITAVAVDYISELNLGKNGVTDVLNIGYSLAPYPGDSEGTYRYELEDAYLRLDKDLEKLLDTLYRQVGKDNLLVYLVSTGYFTEPSIENPSYRLPGGTFSVKRAISLLNAFLSAKYGNGAYIDHYAASHIYLSKNTIEEKNLDLSKVASEARDFLVRMSGVSDAFTSADLMSPAIPRLEALRLSIDPKTSGDIILEFNPGWKVVDDSRFPSTVQPVKTAVYPAPAFIMGPGVSPKVVDTPVEASSLAPMLAGTLRIRPPNGIR